MERLLISPTKMFPDGATVKPATILKPAAVPVPSNELLGLPPARVVTSPAGGIFLILISSETYRLPESSISIPHSLLNSALTAAPAPYPAVLLSPANLKISPNSGAGTAPPVCTGTRGVIGELIG